MASYTFNLNLKKPDMSDRITPADFNGNFDILDSRIADILTYGSSIDNLEESVRKINAQLGNLSDIIDAINGEVI